MSLSLENTLKTAAENLRGGVLQNEDQVKLSIVLPILSALGWDCFNPKDVMPEFRLANGRVDYALCETHSTPLVFIEAKSLGKADSSGEGQVFEYAYKQGVPFLILTDGNIWNFYLGTGLGSSAERRFYRAELQREDKHRDYAKMFNTYLNRDRVISGEAKKDAEAQHTNERAKTKARKTIPEVWRKLMAEPDEMLRDVLAEAVEDECGIKPALDDVELFLQEREQPAPASVSSHRSQPVTKTTLSPSRKGNKISGFTLDGKPMQLGVANRVLAEVLKEFQKRDPGFLPRFAQETIGRTRRLVAQARDELYDYANLTEYSVELEDGWWLGTNLSTQSVRNNIKIACQIAGVKFGSQLTLF